MSCAEPGDSKCARQSSRARFLTRFEKCCVARETQQTVMNTLLPQWLRTEAKELIQKRDDWLRIGCGNDMLPALTVTINGTKNTATTDQTVTTPSQCKRRKTSFDEKARKSFCSQQKRAQLDPEPIAPQ